MPVSSRPTTGVAVLALLAVVDMSWVVLAWFGALGSSDAPPAGALVFFALVGAVTLATARPARRGHRTAAWVMVGSRVLSVVLIDLPAFVLDAPVGIIAVASVAILLAALGIWWTAPLLSRGGAGSRAASRAAS
jgi:hypothetical protein